MPTIYAAAARSSHQRVMHLYSIVAEFVLTIAVGYALFCGATPLTLLSAEFSVATRYRAIPLPLSGAITWEWMGEYARLPWWQPLSDEVRALLLLRHVGAYLVLFGVSGWMALQLARRNVVSGRWFALAVWSGVAWLLRPFHVPPVVWAVIGAFIVCIAFVGLMCQSHCHSEWRGAPLNPLAACVWPGWLLLTGVGLLIQVDFAATGPLVPHGQHFTPVKPGARFFGLNQADALWLATGILLVVVGWRSTLLNAWVSICEGGSALLARPRGPFFILALALFFAFFLGWLGLVKSRFFLGVPGLNGGGKPHIAGEMLRLASCCVLAWLFYRRGEWQGSRTKTMRAAAVILAIVILCTLGLFLANDKGPLLILALALPMLVVTPIFRSAPSHWRAMFISLLCVAGLIWAWRTALVEWLPHWSDDAAKRAALFADAFTAHRPTMAQVRWLLDAYPPGGFGLGQVPYCGARALADVTRCTLGSGAPLQMPSDLAYVQLVVTFGATTATCFIAALLAWLWLCIAGQWWAWVRFANTETFASTSNRVVLLLPLWLVAVPALASQAQTIVSVGASLSWSSLTGVTLPLLGYGGSALCVTALWVGLCMHSHITVQSKPA